MLVYHAHALGNGIFGRIKFNRFPAEQNFSGGRLKNAVKHVHQRRLSRAVFSDNGVNFTLSNSEIDFVISSKIAIFFC